MKAEGTLVERWLYQLRVFDTENKEKYLMG